MSKGTACFSTEYIGNTDNSDSSFVYRVNIWHYFLGSDVQPQVTKFRDINMNEYGKINLMELYEFGKGTV